MKKDIIIVGGGIIGLMCAYYLQKNNKSVTIIDKDDITNSTSFGNAGLLSAFGKNPLSAPGVLLNTAKQILKGESPVNLYPSFDYTLLKWLLSFTINANQKRLNKTLALFQRYGKISMQEYSNMSNKDNMDFYFHNDGLLMVYTQEDTYNEKLTHCTDKRKYKILNKKELKEYIPFANNKIIGAILLKENGHLDPALLMKELKLYLEKKDVEFILNEKVIKLEFFNSKISKIHTLNNSYEANNILLSTGWDSTLSKQAKNNFLMTPAKGYSITFEMPELLKPKTALLFADMFIAMTPREKTVRLTSKLELGSKNLNIDEKQIQSILNNFHRYANNFEMKNQVKWAGFRPLTPNDMPILGFDKKYTNLVHATGLGWLGITFAPAIGKIICDLIIKDKKNENNIDILAFSQIYQV